MPQDDDKWSADANEAFQISLVKWSPNGIRTLASFHPKFTYPIFGDDERIFGYQGLKIDLRYHATDMRPNLQVSYNKKFKPVGDTEANDITGILKEYLPDVAFQRNSDFEAALKQPTKDWIPPLGERIKEFDVGHGAKYEVWMGSLADPAVKQMVNRVQILVPLFIEGGSFIGTDESEYLDRWSIFFLYSKKPVLGSDEQWKYEFVGYSTVYRFFHFSALTPPASPKPGQDAATSDDFELPAQGSFSFSQLPCRPRIAQFLILPSFQHKGNASRLYSTIFEHYLHNPETIDITVEDPNEAFDSLRDLCDYEFLLKLPEFRAIHIDTSVTIPKKGPVPNIVVPADLEPLRMKTKIAPRQFQRMVEMYLMSKLPESVKPTIAPELDAEMGTNAGKQKKPSSAPTKKAAPTEAEEHEYHLWKLFTKQRLYRHNKDTLGQLVLKERLEKLEETVTSVEFDYARLLPMFESRRELAEKEEANAKTEAKGKAKAIPEPLEGNDAGTKRKRGDTDNEQPSQMKNKEDTADAGKRKRVEANDADDADDTEVDEQPSVAKTGKEDTAGEKDAASKEDVAREEDTADKEDASGKGKRKLNEVDVSPEHTSEAASKKARIAGGADT